MKCTDLTGMKFGRLLVLEKDNPIITNDGRKRAAWRCQCDCGNIVTALGDSLRSGGKKSCGCLATEAKKTNSKTHGMTNTSIYNVWCSMKRRCGTKSDSVYKDYGGRGIKVCDEWKVSFESFYGWATHNGYQEGLTIDRIDVNGNYEPDNCRWITMKEQCSNRRSNHYLEYNGEKHTITRWAEILGISPKTLFSRVYSGWSAEKIINYSNNIS